HLHAFGDVGNHCADDRMQHAFSPQAIAVGPDPAPACWSLNDHPALSFSLEADVLEIRLQEMMMFGHEQAANVLARQAGIATKDFNQGRFCPQDVALQVRRALKLAAVLDEVPVAVLTQAESFANFPLLRHIHQLDYDSGH